jgi:hypothetical protein
MAGGLWSCQTWTTSLQRPGVTTARRLKVESSAVPAHGSLRHAARISGPIVMRKAGPPAQPASRMQPIPSSTTNRGIGED